MDEQARSQALVSTPPEHRVRRWMPTLAAGLSIGQYMSHLMRRMAALTALLLLGIWALDGEGYFWPAWAWLGLAVPVTLDIAGRWAWHHERGASRRVACVWAVILVATGILVFTWILTRMLDGVTEFWPAWALLGLGTAGSGYSLIALHDRVLVARGKRALRARIELLARTRREAVDAQAAQLRQIERDLHDGAQARLVALTLQLGRAELKLEDRPEVLSLIHEARREAHSAIAELRDLARGIVPPLLAERGLQAAVRSLAARYGLGTTVDAQTPHPLTPAVESAAYFVIAEALTNTAKHARASRSWVQMTDDGRSLTILVGDDGCGGADASGSGLAGLRARVAALDGTMSVESPLGTGTVVRVSLPSCGPREGASSASAYAPSAAGLPR
jgi:signal transduction histidine kinase